MSTHILQSNSPEGNIAPSTLRVFTAFTGFVSEIYLGKTIEQARQTSYSLSLFSICVLVNAHRFDITDLVNIRDPPQFFLTRAMILTNL